VLGIKRSSPTSRTIIKSMWSSSCASKSTAGQPRKCTFCPTDREIDWTDVAGMLKLIYVWSCIAIRHQITCGSIGDHGMKNSKRHCAARDLSSARRPINEVKWPFLWQVIAVINSLFWTDQSDSRKKELQIQVIMVINHVTPIIMEVNHDN